jgi:hypothetical protein
MAKLSAHGRTELARLTKEGSGKSQYSGGPVWKRVTLAIMSDLNILKKVDCKWEDGRSHSYGWKLYRKIKAGTTVDKVVDVFTKIGYNKV